MDWTFNELQNKSFQKTFKTDGESFQELFELYFRKFELLKTFVPNKFDVRSLSISFIFHLHLIFDHFTTFKYQFQLKASKKLNKFSIFFLRTSPEFILLLTITCTHPTVTSNILLPTELDTAISPNPLRATITDVIKSGIEVPAARNVRPITCTSD